jgi:flagellar M-ring protein FliF
MDRTLSHTKQPFGGIQRLSVAVLIAEKTITDDEGKVTSEKLSAPELEAMTRLVRDAVGYDEKRGDTVSVSSMAFYQASDEAAEAEEPGFLQSPTVQSYGKQGLAAALVLIVVLILVKPLLRALAGGVSGAVGGQTALAGPGGSYTNDSRAPLSYDDKVSVARQLADKNPERVAQIVRAWVQSDG